MAYIGGKVPQMSRWEKVITSFLVRSDHILLKVERPSLFTSTHLCRVSFLDASSSAIWFNQNLLFVFKIDFIS